MFKKRFILFIVFFCIIDCNVAAAIDVTTYKNAKDIVEIYKNIGEGKLIPADAKKFQNISSQSIFSGLKSLSADIIRIHGEDKSEKLYPYCKEVLNEYNSEQNSVARLFFYALADKCLAKFYSGISKLGSSNNSTKVFDLFKSSPKDLRQYFLQYFTSLDNSSMQFLEISEDYKDLIKKDNSFFDDEIISLLNPSRELSEIIQITSGPGRAEKILFQKELKNILNQVLQFYDNGNISESVKYFDYAVSFYSENLDNLDLKRSWLDFTSTAKSLLSRGEIVLSKKIMDYSSTISLEEMRNESVFNQYWSFILKGDFKTPIALAKKNKTYDNMNSLDQRLVFWIGYCHHKLGEKSFSQKYFSYLVNTYPLSYYSAVTLNYNMYKHSPIKSIRQIASVKENNFSNSLERIKSWAYLGYDKFVNAEIDSIIDSVSKQDINDSERNYKIEKLAEILFNNNRHYLNFRMLHQMLNDKLVLSEKMIGYLFPYENIGVLKKNLGPFPLTFPISLMRQESAFSRTAISVAGARGLMQLMPGTARRYKKRVKIKDLYKPEINIKIGMMYLKDLAKRYDGNLISILSAYNAGEGNVAKWRKNILVYDDPLINIETIPFRETRQYVKLIYRNMFFYSMLLGEKPLNGFKIAI